MKGKEFATFLVLVVSWTLSPIEALAEAEETPSSFALARAMQDVRTRLFDQVAEGIVTVQVVRNDQPRAVLNLLQNQIGSREYREWNERRVDAEELPLWQAWGDSLLRVASDFLIEASLENGSAGNSDFESLLAEVHHRWNGLEEPLRKSNPEQFERFRQLVDFEFKSFSAKQKARSQPNVVRQSTGFVFAPGIVVTTLDMASPRNDQEWIRVFSDKQIEFSTGELLGTDKETNIAVIQVPTSDLDLRPTIDFSHVSAPGIGSFVFSFYHAFNQPLSMRTAEITGVDRRLPFFHCATFLETSLPTSPGTLGSPIVDLEGRLVGMTTVFMSQGTMSEVTFALPTSYLKSAVEQICKHQHVERGCLGVLVEERSTDDGDGTEVQVSQVLEGSPAFGAGVREGDVILALGSIPVHCRGTLIDAISQFKPYDEVTVEIQRNKERQTLKVPLAPLPFPTFKSR